MQGDYVIHYEGFTDECNDGQDDKSINDVYAQVYQDFDDRQKQQPIIRGHVYDELGCDNNPVLYSVYKKLDEGTRCWKGYKKKGTKMMFGKRVPNCVKNESQEKFITHKELARIIYKYTQNLQLARDFDNLEDEFISQDDMQSSFLSSIKNDSLEFDRERVNKILSMHRVPVKVIKKKQDDQFNTLYSILQTVATNEGEVVGMNPHAVKPFFSPEEADRANDEWVNQAQVDQEDGVIVRGTDDKQYRIMTSYNNEHFEDGEVYLDGLTDPTYIDLEGYPDAAELLYYHSATGHYPEDPDELDEIKLDPNMYKDTDLDDNSYITDTYQKATQTKYFYTKLGSLQGIPNTAVSYTHLTLPTKA